MKKIIHSLIGDFNEKPVSMSRLMIFISFFILCWYWVAPLINPALQDIKPPSTLADIIKSFLIYEGYKKGAVTVKSHLNNKKKEQEDG